MPKMLPAVDFFCLCLKTWLASCKFGHVSFVSDCMVRSMKTGSAYSWPLEIDYKAESSIIQCLYDVETDDAKIYIYIYIVLLY